MASLASGPSPKLYPIDVSLPMLSDKAEFAYPNDLPTSFVLSAGVVDRLRAAAGTVLLASPDFRKLVDDVGASIVASPAVPAPPRPGPIGH